MGSVHPIHRTQQSSLAELTAEIYEAIDRMVMRVGSALDEAFREHREDYARWVTEELPFGLDAARRMRMIYVAYRELPVDVLAKMPKPWQAMFALRHIPRPELEAAIEAGVIGPDTTVTQARAVARRWGESTPGRLVTPAPVTQAEAVAGRLLSFAPSDLTPATRQMLDDWLRASG